MSVIPKNEPTIRDLAQRLIYTKGGFAEHLNDLPTDRYPVVHVMPHQTPNFEWAKQ